MFVVTAGSSMMECIGIFFSRSMDSGEHGRPKIVQLRALDCRTLRLLVSWWRSRMAISRPCVDVTLLQRQPLCKGTRLRDRAGEPKLVAPQVWLRLSAAL